VGSAMRFQERWSTHLRDLRKGRHHNKFLQADFTKSGESSFTFSILELVSGGKREREEREQVWLDRLWKETGSSNQRYNHSPKAVISETKKPKEKNYRSENYWFLGPDKTVEYVVENLSFFCEQLGLPRNRMAELASGKIKFYKGWTLQNARGRFTKLTNNATKEEIETKDLDSLNSLAKRLGIQQSHLSKLLAGTRKSCGHWKIKGREVISRPHKGKVYWLTSPAGKDVKVNNLRLFASRHALEISCLRSVLAGTQKSHKGWMPRGRSQEQLKQYHRQSYRQKAMARKRDPKTGQFS